ncbi:MAG: GreA/GreB family elongation factor [Planctomycetota bacterium]|nr:GreA/GreB family elongation factor [Planctomycetota bacterium]
MSKFTDRLTQTMNEQSWGEYEEAWLDAIEGGTVHFAEYLQATNRAISAGHGERAGQMLELLLQSGHTDDLSPDKKVEFHEVLACSLPRNKDARSLLLDIYKSQFGHIDGFENCVTTSGLMDGTRPNEIIPLFKRMVHYQPGSYVKHRSGWGVGVVKELDATIGSATVDFQKKEGHSVKLEALPQICDPLDADHYLVMGWKRPDELRSLADQEPGEMIKLVLRTSNKPIPLSRIKEALSGIAVPASSWSKWWTRARTAIKKDPLVGQSGGKNNELYLLDGPEALTTSIDRRFANLTPNDRLKTIRECLIEFQDDEHALLAPQFKLLRRDIARGDLEPAQRISALLLLTDHSPDGDEVMSIGAIVMKAAHPADLLNMLGREEDQKETLAVIRKLDPDRWITLREELMLKSDDSLRELIIQMYESSDELHMVDQIGSSVLLRPGKSPLLFLHMVRRSASGDHKFFPCLKGVSSSDLFRQAAAIFDRLSLEGEVNKTAEITTSVKRYRQQLSVKPFGLLKRVLENCDLTDAREIYMQLAGARSISDSNLEKAKAIILRKFPKVLAGQARRGSVADRQSAIYSTQAGMNKVQDELTDIRNEKLPAIFKAIGDAAALGDLSENAEFTSAIEERENLNRRVMELQGSLDRARLINPDEASTTQIGLGCKVRYHNISTDTIFEYCLLGPWDGGPDEGVLSYLSPLGTAMLQKKVGEEFEVKLPTGVHKVRVLEISRGQVSQKS